MHGAFGAFRDGPGLCHLSPLPSFTAAHVAANTTTHRRGFDPAPRIREPARLLPAGPLEETRTRPISLRPPPQPPRTRVPLLITLLIPLLIPLLGHETAAPPPASQPRRDPSPGAAWIPRGQSGNPMEHRNVPGSLTARAGLRQAEKPGRTGFSRGMAARKPGLTKRREGREKTKSIPGSKGARDGADRPSERRKQGERTGESRRRGAAKGRRAAAKGEGQGGKGGRGGKGSARWAGEGQGKGRAKGERRGRGGRGATRAFPDRPLLTAARPRAIMGDAEEGKSGRTTGAARREPGQSRFCSPNSPRNAAAVRGDVGVPGEPRDGSRAGGAGQTRRSGPGEGRKKTGPPLFFAGQGRSPARLLFCGDPRFAGTPASGAEGLPGAAPGGESAPCRGRPAAPGRPGNLRVASPSETEGEPPGCGAGPAAPGHPESRGRRPPGRLSAPGAGESPRSRRGLPR